jgi:uncharacterized membrane protein YgdD (TMEM256/DUF423 family)
MTRFWYVAGAINALVSVAMGAFGAHALRARLTERMLQNWETGARYQMYHAFGMFVIAQLSMTRGNAVDPAGWSMLVGTVLFSGSLYAMALTGMTRLGAITPLGGVAMLIGWTWLARTAMR